jgi:hypothetical protein
MGGAGGGAAGSVGTGGGPPGLTVEQACIRSAETSCELDNKCSPFYIRWAWGDLATCKALTTIGCEARLGANGSNWTPSATEACRLSYLSLSCEEWLNGTEAPAACRPPPGALPDGTACGNAAQCEHGYCKKPRGSRCGVCSVKAPAGAACERSADCQFGLCIGKACVPWSTTGEPCDDLHLCYTGACSAGPGASGVCLASIHTQDASCNPDADGCDLFDGLECNAQTSTCQLIALGTQGEGCQDTALFPCTRFGICSNNVCEESPLLGAPCDAINGASCLYPGTCIGGVCVLDDPNTCR